MLSAGGSDMTPSARTADRRQRGRRVPLTLLVTSAGAVVVALAKQLIPVLASQPWKWVDFWTDVVQNAFLAVLVSSFVTAVKAREDRDRLVRTQQDFVRARTGLASTALGWHTVPRADLTEAPQAALATVVEDLVTTASEWRELAVRLDQVHGDYPPAEFEDESEDQGLVRRGVGLILLEHKIWGYMMEGGRHRRLIFMRSLMADLAALEMSPDSELAALVRRCRSSAVDLEAWVQHTDATIVENLLIDPVSAHDGPSWTEAAAEQQSVQERNLSAAAASADYVNVLLVRLRSLRSTMTAEGVRDPRQSAAMLAVVNRCLGALRNEIRFAATLTESLAALMLHIEPVDTP